MRFAQRTRLPLLAALHIAAAAWILPSSLLGQTGKAEAAKERTVDHAAIGTGTSFHVTLKEGEKLTVKIVNTAPDCFEYPLSKVKLAAQAGATEKEIEIVHEPGYGGYVIEIRRTSSADACGTSPNSDLEDATIIIVVDTENIEVAFGGGFTFSDLTNPVFASRKDPLDDSKNVVFRDTGAEDDLSLSVGAFIHVYGKHWSKKIPSVTFGLGVGEDSKTTYYLGPFWRLGKQAFIGGGVMASSVERLPAGVQVGDPLTDANTLANLGSKTKTGFFVALTYTFLGGKEPFEKPFKKASGTSTAAGASVTPAAPAQTPPAATTLKDCSKDNFDPKLAKPSGSVSAGQLTFEGEAGCKPGSTGNAIQIAVTKESDPFTDTLSVTLGADGKFSRASGQTYSTGKFTATLTLLDGATPIAGAPATASSFDVQ